MDGRVRSSREYYSGKYHCTIDLLFDWFRISCMTTDNFCFYLQNRLIQTSQTGGQWYSDTSLFGIPWFVCQWFLITTPCFGIYEKSYEILKIIILVTMPYSKSDQDILGEPLVLNTPSPLEFSYEVLWTPPDGAYSQNILDRVPLS
jgi:hypothetical protein